MLAELPVSGGGTNESGAGRGLADAFRINSASRHRDGDFFRAKLQAHVPSLRDQRKDDPYFSGNPSAKYGGKSLHLMSHREARLSVMKLRFEEGLLLLDEPEAALSPQRHLAFLDLMYDLARGGKSPFLIATHSPELMT